jgi:hypothetical protein
MKAHTLNNTIAVNHKNETQDEAVMQRWIAFACISFFPAMYVIGKFLMSL